jgi:hypothetical protein
MASPAEEEVENLIKYLKTYGTKTFHNLLSALLIWLFGNLVFIPLANSLNWQTRVFCSLLFFIVFTILILKALPGLKKLIAIFSIFPARKTGVKKGLSYENSLLLFRCIFHIISALILYLLYFPFLTGFHPSISGLVLILLLIWIFFLTFRIIQVLFHKILEWML